MRHDKFEAFLRERFVSRMTGQPLTARAVGSCLSRLKRTEKLLMVTLSPDTFNADRFAALSQELSAKVRSGEIPLQGSRDCVAALRHYLEYAQMLRGEEPSKETYAYEGARG